MKKINIQKIILVLIPVLFIFSGVSKADTYLMTGLSGTNLPFTTNGVHTANVSVILTTNLDKPSYNIGDVVNYSISVSGAGYSNSDIGTSGTLNPYLIPVLNPSDQYRNGTIFNTIWSSSTCASTSFLTTCLNSSAPIPATISQYQLGPWVNHGPPYSPSEYTTVQKSIFDLLPTSGLTGVNFNPIVGFSSQDPQFGSCYGFNSTGPISPSTPGAICYVSVSQTFTINKPDVCNTTTTTSSNTPAPQTVQTNFCVTSLYFSTSGSNTQYKAGDTYNGNTIQSYSCNPDNTYGGSSVATITFAGSSGTSGSSSSSSSTSAPVTTTDTYTATANDSTYSTLVCHNRTDLSGSRFSGGTFNYNVGDNYKGGTIDSISCSPSNFSHTQEIAGQRVAGTGSITYTVAGTTTTTTTTTSGSCNTSPKIFVK